MATIRNRGPSQWQATIRRRGYPKESKTFELRADAEAWARALESEMDRGVFISRSLAERTTLDELLVRYLKEITPEKRGAYSEEKHIKSIRLYPIVQFSVAAIDGQILAKFRDQMLADGFAPATVVRRIQILSHVFTVAAREWGYHVPHGNPVRLVKRPRVKNGRDRRLRPGEEQELLSRARRYGGTIEAVIIVALETAMRRENIAELRWEQIDLKGRVAHLPMTKNGDAQDIPLSTRAIQALQSVPRRLDGWVFGMTKYSITQAFARICGTASAKKQSKSREALAPLKDLRFHDLRHEATSRLFERGFNPMQVAAITGHRNLQTLKRYTHLRAADLAVLLG